MQSRGRASRLLTLHARRVLRECDTLPSIRHGHTDRAAPAVQGSAPTRSQRDCTQQLLASAIPIPPRCCVVLSVHYSAACASRAARAQTGQRAQSTEQRAEHKAQRSAKGIVGATPSSGTAKEVGVDSPHPSTVLVWYTRTELPRYNSGTRPAQVPRHLLCI
eukprot:COSAG02_NODE_3525_length_6615_cov_2.025629_6_plen_162_part_00